MSTFESATTKKYAGLSLAFAFEALGDIELASEDRDLTPNEAEWLKQVAVVCAESCSETITHGEVDEQWHMWKTYMSDGAGYQGCIPTIMEASEFLKENGTWTSARKTELMIAVMRLGTADDTVTDNEKKMLGLIALLMDAKSELEALLS